MREFIYNVTTSQWSGPIIIPVAFMAIGVIAKAIAKKRLERDSFFLGVEGCLAAMSLALSNVLFQARDMAETEAIPTSEDMAVLFGLLVMNFGGVVFVLFFHQTCEPMPQNLQPPSYTEPTLRRRIWVQGIFCTGIGMGLLVINAILFR